MLDLVRPRCFIPVHGTLHHLTRHAELAREAGVNTAVVAENGERVELEDGTLTKQARVHVPRIHRYATREIAHAVLKQRMALAAEGIAVIFLAVTTAGRKIRVRMTSGVAPR